MLPLAAEYGVKILPADSEHSAIFQCMQGLPVGGLRRIILTASGGAFRDWPVEKLREVRAHWGAGQGLDGEMRKCRRGICLVCSQLRNFESWYGRGSLAGAPGASPPTT